MEEITLNLIPTGVRPTCHVSQNDNKRDIKINLAEGNLAYSIKENDVIKLNVRKPNDTVITSRIAATTGNTYVIANITDDMCNIDGTNLCEIRITNGTTRISTSNFLMEVEADPAANGGGGGGASNLSDLDDVDISNPSDGQVLKYNGTSEMWENGTGGSGGADSFADLDDVSLSNLQNGQVPKWNSSSQKWENANESGGGGASWTDLTATLTAGQTSLVFSNVAITVNSTIDVYVDDAFYGVTPMAVVLESGSLTLRFFEQYEDMPVKVRIT